jgi:tetratricopeptide (TPR) repeat protein
MKLTWNTLQKQFLIRGGEIVFFNSTQPEESLSHVITVKKWLKESSSEAFEADPEHVIRLVLKEGACTFDELRKAYFKLMKAALLQVFHWPQFRGEFYPADIENGLFVSLRISELLLDASRTLLSTEWIKERMSTDSLIHKTPIFEKLVAPFPLTPEESFLAFRFEGEDMNLNTLTVLTGFPEERVLRMTYLLQKIGALELRSAAVRQVKRARKPAYPRSDEFRQPDPVKQQPPANPVDEKPAVEQQPPALLEKPTQAPSAEPFVASPTQSKEKQAWAQKSAELCFQKAEAEYEDGNYGKAAHHCKEALQHHQDAKYYHLLGASYARHPRFQRDAEEALHKAISLSPSDPDYHAILAMFYSQRGLWLRARTHCLKALDISAGHKAANEVYQKVLENKPGKGDCWCVSALKK